MYFSRMECENQVFFENNGLKSFVEGGLFKEEDSGQSKRDLMKKLEQFTWLPVGAKN